MIPRLSLSPKEQEKAQGKAAQIAEGLARLDLVIPDELGYLPFSAIASVNAVEISALPEAVIDRGRVARPFGSALTDPGRRLSRTRLFLEVTRIEPLVVSKGE